MIDVRYTTKLLFKKYPYQVNLLISVPTTGKIGYREQSVALFDLRKWLGENCGTNYRTYVSWRKSYVTKNDQRTLVHKCYFNVYMENKNNFEAMLRDHESLIVSTTSPLNDEHEEMLKQGVRMEIRDILFYRRFRYKVSFKAAWRDSKNRAHITELVNTQLHDNSKTRQDYIMHTADCTLYLAKSSDLMMVKLAVGDTIKYLTMVTTTSELGLPPVD